MRILPTSNPGFGHVHPMVPLARALAGERRAALGRLGGMPGPDDVAAVLADLC